MVVQRNSSTPVSFPSIGHLPIENVPTVVIYSFFNCPSLKFDYTSLTEKSMFNKEVRH